MSSERRTLQLDEICEFVNGFAFKPTSYVPKSVDTYEVFRMGYISRGGGFKEDNSPVFVQKAHPKLDKYFLRYGDIVIAMTDMKDKVAILANTARVTHNNRFVLNQRAGLIRVKRPDLVCPTYLYYYTNWAPHVDYLRSRANSGVQVNLSTSAIKEAEIELPPIFEQKAIGQILLVLDDRIALLRETNATLEAIAQALFKSWFIDFDPVHARARGEEPAGLTSEVAALFPDSFEESELGMIPKGWRVARLGDSVAKITKGTTPTTLKRPFVDSGINFVKAESMDGSGGFIPSKFAFIDDETHNLLARSQLAVGDVLISIAGTIGRIAVMTEDYLPANTNQAVALIRPNQNIFPSGLIYQFLRRAESQMLMGERVVQAVQANLSLGSLSDMKATIPPEATVIKLYSAGLAQIDDAIAHHRQQAQTLAILRDTLLPRLISGQLRLPEAEAVLQEAGI